MSEQPRRIDYVPLDELQPDELNPKDHNLDVIGESVHRFGFIDPIILDERTGKLISGHGRLETLQAAERSGHDVPDGVKTDAQGRWLAPVSRGWASKDDMEARAALVALNRTVELGGWDDEALALILRDLGESIEGVGFTEHDLAELEGELEEPARLTDPDEAPAAPKEPVSKTGDVWCLGPHRVLCGDATDTQQVSAFLGKERPDCVWTDPPYGVSYVGKTSNSLTIQNDGREGLEDLLLGAFRTLAEVCRPGAPVYVAHADTERIAFEQAMLVAGLIVRQNLIWVKNSIVLGRSDYHYKHEPILQGEAPEDDEPSARTHDPLLYGFTDGGKGRLGRGGPQWYGDNKQSTVFDIAKPPRNADHPTMKPVALIEAMLRNSSPKGGLVLDLFGGSGSTLIACHGLKMRARLVELDPIYVDVICRRYQEHTGVLPVNEKTGVEHDFSLKL